MAPAPLPVDVITATQQHLGAYARTLGGCDLEAESHAAWYLHKTVAEQLLPLTQRLLAEHTDLTARLELARTDAAAVLPTRGLDLPTADTAPLPATR